MCKKGWGNRLDAGGTAFGALDSPPIAPPRSWLAKNRVSSSLLRRSDLEAAPRGAAPAVGSGANVEASGEGWIVFVSAVLEDVDAGAGFLSPGNAPVPVPGGVVKLNDGDGNDDRIEEDGDGVAESIGLKFQKITRCCLINIL